MIGEIIPESCIHLCEEPNTVTGIATARPPWKRRRLFSSDKPKIDVQRGQQPSDPETDVAIEGADLESQTQRDRKHEIEADEDGDVRDGF